MTEANLSCLISILRPIDDYNQHVENTLIECNSSRPRIVSSEKSGGRASFVFDGRVSGPPRVMSNGRVGGPKRVMFDEREIWLPCSMREWVSHQVPRAM